MRFARLAILILFARVASAQTTGATVSGVVHDSIAKRPLAGATVQFVSTDRTGRPARTAISDSLGRFSFDNISDGRYALGFFHAMLDSLGLEAPVREVTVAGRGAMRADLAIPAAATVRGAVCGEASARDSSAVVIGFVRDARTGAAVEDAKVSAEWIEFSISLEGIVRRVPHADVTTGRSGWFAICNVPRSLTIAASHAADSTGLIDVDVPAERLLRQDLYIGASRTIVSDAPPASDTLAPPSRSVRVGNGRLTGTVVAGATGQPLAGAVVSILGGPETRANDRGAWTLVDAPAGTRMLEVRAVNYSPERRPVHVIPDAAPVRVSMTTIKAMLDTVRVTASAADRRRSEFETRRRSGMGYYITAEQIARRNPMVASDLLTGVPGLRMVDQRSGMDKQILVRSASGFGMCAPSLYVNGSYLFTATTDELNGWVQPDEIVGIEVYHGPGTPVQFQQGIEKCGAIVVWTKPVAAGHQLSGRRLVTALSLLALGIALGMVVTR